jgi:hypothetical protein
MMEVTNQSIYTGRDRVHALYFTSFRLFRRLGLWNLPLTVLFTLLGVGVLIGYFSDSLPTALPFVSHLYLYLGLVLVLLGGLLLFFTVLLLWERGTSPTASFLFTDAEINAKFSMRDGESVIKVTYADIAKAYELKRYFYVFYNSKQCFCVVKNGFYDEKDILSLREKLKDELGARLIRY